MADPFFRFFEADRPSFDPSDWPELAVEELKTYPRSPRVLLPAPGALPDISLAESLLRRKTERNFSETPLPIERIGALFFWSSGLIHKTKQVVGEGKESLRRPYPSGGARYPLEVYAVLFRCVGIAPGAYHYAVAAHALEAIPAASWTKIRDGLPEGFARHAAGAVLVSFVGERTISKYGPLGYKFGLLEAGHIGQNMYLVGTALGMGVAAIGSMDYTAVERELGLPDEEETVIYGIVIG